MTWACSRSSSTTRMLDLVTLSLSAILERILVAHRQGGTSTSYDVPDALPRPSRLVSIGRVGGVRVGLTVLATDFAIRVPTCRNVPFRRHVPLPASGSRDGHRCADPTG